MEALPTEVLLHILEYLPFDDQQRMALVNTAWYNASIHPVIAKNRWFVFNPSSGRRFKSFMKTLSKTKRIFINLKLENCKEYDKSFFHIFEHLGSRLISLNASNLFYLTDLTLDSITLYCENLKTLEIVKTRNLSFSDKPRKPLQNLEKLTFTGIDITVKVFNILMNCMPNLKDLGLLNTRIKENLTSLEQSYPKNSRQASALNSYNEPTSANISKILETATSLNTLRLSECFTHPYVGILLKLPKHIKLKSLILACLNCPYFETNICFENVGLALSTCTSLQMLEMYNMPISLLSAISNLPNLILLKFHYTFESEILLKPLFESFVKLLNEMKYIRTLSMVPWLEPITTMSDEFKIPALPDCTIKSLKSLDICCIKNGYNIVTLGKNLTSLNILNGAILSANEFRLLFKNLTNLKHLEIKNCRELVDDVLTDCSNGENSLLSNLKGLNTLKLVGAKLTYHCLRTIKLMHLRDLDIGCLSVQYCIILGDMTDFEDSFKNSDRFLPALENLTLTLPFTEYVKTKKYFDIVFGMRMNLKIKNFKKFKCMFYSEVPDLLE